MQITKVLVKDFGCFEDFEVEFAPGLNVLLGPNGSGKSTLLSAIYFTVYCETLNDREDWIRYGCRKAQIRVELDVNGAKYLLVREVGAGQSPISLYEGDGRCITGLNKVKSHLLETVLHMPPGFLPWYLKQGEIQQFADLLADSSLDILRLLGVGKVTTLRSYLDTVLKREFGTVEADYVQASSYVAGIGARLQSLQTELDKLRSAEIARNKIRLAGMIDRLQQIRNAQNVQLRIDQLTQQLQTLQQEISRRIQAQHQIYANLMQRYEILRQEAAKIQAPSFDVLVDAWQRQKAAREQLDRLLVDDSQLRHTFARYYRSRQAPVRKQAEQIRTTLILLAEKIKNYREIGAVEAVITSSQCPFCGQTLDLNHIQKMKQDYLQVCQEYSRLTKELEVLEAQMNARSAIRQQCRNLQQRHRQLLSTIQQYTAYNILDLSIDIPKVYYEYVSLTSEDKSTRDQVTQLQEQMAALNTSLEQLKATCDLSVLEGWTLDAEATDRSLQEAIAEKVRYDELEKRYTELMEQYETAEQTYQQSLQDKQKLWDRVRVRRVARGLFTELEESAIGVALSYVLDHVLPLINRFLEDMRSPFLIRYEGSFVADFDDGRTLPLYRLSYGQKVILSVVASYAFYLNSLSRGVLIADEPLAGLDAENTHLMVGFLNRLHHYAMDRRIQCIVSTHDTGDVAEANYHVVRLV